MQSLQPFAAIMPSLVPLVVSSDGLAAYIAEVDPSLLKALTSDCASVNIKVCDAEHLNIRHFSDPNHNLSNAMKGFLNKSVAAEDIAAYDRLIGFFHQHQASMANAKRLLPPEHLAANLPIVEPIKGDVDKRWGIRFKQAGDIVQSIAGVELVLPTMSHNGPAPVAWKQLQKDLPRALSIASFLSWIWQQVLHEFSGRFQHPTVADVPAIVAELHGRIDALGLEPLVQSAMVFEKQLGGKEAIGNSMQQLLTDFQREFPLQLTHFFAAYSQPISAELAGCLSGSSSLAEAAFGHLKTLHFGNNTNGHNPHTMECAIGYHAARQALPEEGQLQAKLDAIPEQEFAAMMRKHTSMKKNIEARAAAAPDETRDDELGESDDAETEAEPQAVTLRKSQQRNRKALGVYPCRFREDGEKCSNTTVYNAIANRNAHENKQHGRLFVEGNTGMAGKTNKPKTHKCKEEGCNKAYVAARRLAEHIASQHPDAAVK